MSKRKSRNKAPRVPQGPPRIVVDPPVEPEVHAPDAERVPGDPFLSQIAGVLGDNFITARRPSYDELAQDHAVLKRSYDELAALTEALRAQFGMYVQAQMAAPVEFVVAIRHPANEQVMMWWSQGSDPRTLCALGLQNPANFGGMVPPLLPEEEDQGG